MKYREHPIPENKQDLTTLRNIFKSTLMMCSINIKERKPEEDAASIDEVLKSLSCPVCYNFMKPPIYVCQIGHSVCSGCKVQMYNCPTCRNPLREGRNYALEHISEHFSKNNRQSPAQPAPQPKTATSFRFGAMRNCSKSNYNY